LAVIAHLADEQGSLSIPVASDLALTISRSPETFESPVSYVDPEDIVKEEEHDDYALEEEGADYEDEAAEEES
jgi:hypothetical protein